MTSPTPTPSAHQHSLDLSAVSLDTRPSEDQAALHDAYWDERCPEDWEFGMPNLTFHVHSKGITPENSDKPEDQQILHRPLWSGCLQVWAKNIPRLMRNGFHWNSSNVLKERSYFELYNKVLDNESSHIKVFFLKDVNEEKEWKARLTIFTQGLATFAAFGISWVSLEHVIDCEAFNWNRKMVYKYFATSDGKPWAHNAIHNQMPLDGWWPWPKNEGS